MMKTMKNVLTLLVILAATGLFTSACQPTAFYGVTNEKIEWRTLADGKEEAKQKNMPVLVDFFSTVNCIRCEYMEQTVYANDAVAKKVNQNFIPVRIYKNFEPTTAELTLSRRLNSNGECILAFLNPDGSIVADTKGNHVSSMEQLTVDETMSYMDQALANVK